MQENSIFKSDLKDTVTLSVSVLFMFVVWCFLQVLIFFFLLQHNEACVMWTHHIIAFYLTAPLSFFSLMSFLSQICISKSGYDHFVPARDSKYPIQTTCGVFCHLCLCPPSPCPPCLCRLPLCWVWEPWLPSLRIGWWHVLDPCVPPVICKLSP